MITATEVRLRREATLITLDEWSERINDAMKPVLEKLIEELDLLPRQVWARYDRCCHGGRRCLPVRETYDIAWSPSAYAVNPRLKD